MDQNSTNYEIIGKVRPEHKTQGPKKRVVLRTHIILSGMGMVDHSIYRTAKSRDLKELGRADNDRQNTKSKGRHRLEQLEIHLHGEPRASLQLQRASILE